MKCNYLRIVDNQIQQRIAHSLGINKEIVEYSTSNVFEPIQDTSESSFEEGGIEELSFLEVSN